jgi:hypothetical protein
MDFHYTLDVVFFICRENSGFIKKQQRKTGTLREE